MSRKSLALSNTHTNGTEAASNGLLQPEPPLPLVEFTLTPNRLNGRWTVGFDFGSQHFEYDSEFYCSHTPDRLIRVLRHQVDGAVRVVVNAVK